MLVGAVVGGLFVLALPPVHWRAYGWARGEPFYHGRPASYWSTEIAACDATTFPIICCMTVVGEPFPGPTMVLVRRPGALDRARHWLADTLNRPHLVPNERLTLDDDTREALPVLIALLADPIPQVRYFAAQCIEALHAAGRPALPQLRRIADDQAEVSLGLSAVLFTGTGRHQEVFKVAVAQVVAHAIYTLETDKWRKRDEADSP
jgi:hypothetical protein